MGEITHFQIDQVTTADKSTLQNMMMRSHYNKIAFHLLAIVHLVRTFSDEDMEKFWAKKTKNDLAINIVTRGTDAFVAFQKNDQRTGLRLNSNGRIFQPFIIFHYFIANLLNKMLAIIKLYTKLTNNSFRV